VRLNELDSCYLTFECRLLCNRSKASHARSSASEPRKRGTSDRRCAGFW